MRTRTSLLASLLLVTLASATPPGTQVISDPAGDVYVWSDVDGSPWLDLRGVWLDSNGTHFTVTFLLEDLTENQLGGGYRFLFTVRDGTSSHEDSILCRFGNTGVGVGPAVEQGRDILGLYDLCHTWNTHHAATEVVFDADADTIAATFTYGAVDAASGNVLEDFEARVGNMAVYGVSNSADDAVGAGTYTLA